jgi:demethylmenaquinone methyltransferase/2-methoxy-6-polyprenyl-1,4-benzoquinol methylase
MSIGEMHPALAVRGEERSRRVRDMFASIAPRYELVNRVASFGLDRAWRREVVAALALSPGDWCLDACCGTGDLSREIARTGVRVIGVDFCPEMIRVGQGGSPAAQVALEADARRLPVKDQSMDAACVAFGLRNVVPPEVALAEMARVVRPGGRVAVLEFSEPRIPLVRRASRAYERRLLPWLGDLLSGRPGTYRYLPETIEAWHSPQALADLMEGAGLAAVHWRALALGIVTLHVGDRACPPGGRS